MVAMVVATAMVAVVATPARPDPVHWTDAYVGRRYVAGRHDCVDLVVTVLREHFSRVWRPPPRAEGVRARDAQVAALAGEHARALGPGEIARDGDGVLMRAAGRQRGIGHHIGLYVALSTGPATLHCQRHLGTVLQPLAGLPARGLEVVGLYRWL